MTEPDRVLEDFRNRLVKMAKHRRRWAARGIPCYRLYDRDVPGASYAIDRYGGWIHISEYETASVDDPHDDSGSDRRAAVLAIVSDALSVPSERIVLKRRERQRGRSQYERHETPDRWLVVDEHGLKFRVNLTGYLDTGLFLDHRQTRCLVRDEVQQRHFLNLFAYTGAFTVYAAQGGAASTTTVDLSNTYLDWAYENLQLNDLAGPQHEFVRADTFQFLLAQPPRPTYDLVVIDPPTFSNSKRTEQVWDIQNDHVTLFKALHPLLKPDARIIFSTNFRRFRLDEAGLDAVGYSWREITRQTIPDDFKGTKVHRTWKLEFHGSKRISEVSDEADTR